MKRSKRIVCLLLVLLMAAQTLASCGGSETTETTGETTPAVTETAAAEETETEMSANLPEVTYDGATITMLTAAEQWQDYYYVEEDTGEVVDSAVFQRNLVVEEQFDVKLDFNIVNGYYAGAGTVNTALSSAVMGGTGEFDLFGASAGYIYNYLPKNYFIDLNTVEYLDLAQKWWLTDNNEMITVGGHLYLAAGTLGMSCLDNVRVIYLNKILATDLGLPSMYDHVNDGTWTYDTFKTYTEMAYADLDGDGAYSAGDQYGYAGTADEGLDAIAYGLGRKNTVIGDDGMPYAIGNPEWMEEIYQTVRTMKNEKVLYYGTKEGDPVVELYPMFAENRVLFMFYSLKAATSGALGDVEDFGILPYPKSNEEQEKYHTFGFSDVFGIPRGQTDADVERNGVILEAMNFENYKRVYPAYKEVALQRKYARDEESAEMIDIILDGTYMDFGLMNYGNIDVSLLYITQIFGKYESYATYWAAQGKAIETKITNLLETMSSFEE